MWRAGPERQGSRARGKCVSWGSLHRMPKKAARHNPARCASFVASAAPRLGVALPEFLLALWTGAIIEHGRGTLEAAPGRQGRPGTPSEATMVASWQLVAEAGEKEGLRAWRDQLLWTGLAIAVALL